MQVAYAADMTNSRAYRENRRYWLKAWVEEVGGPKAFSLLVDTPDTHITAILKGRRNVGDDLAEKIERATGRDRGDMDLPPPDEVEIVTPATERFSTGLISSSSVPKLRDTLIPQYATGGSMGNGLILRDQPGHITSWRVTPEWIQKNVHNITSAGNLAIVTGFGDSMKPMYNPGDPLLVDAGVREMAFDGVYFFRIGEEGFIKRLQRIPGIGIRAISENKAYEPWDIKADMDFQVLARVVKVWRGDDY